MGHGLPGPRGHLLVGSNPEFRRDILGFLAGCARDFGDVSGFRLFHIPCCLVNDPALIEQILVRDADRLVKPWDARQSADGPGQWPADQRGRVLASPRERRSS